MKYKLIIADDEPMINMGIKRILKRESHGFELIGAAENGEEALRLVQEKQADAIITDINMPGINGLDLVAKLKKISPQTICIILTGYDEFDYARRSLQMGVFDYLLKPISSKQLYPLLDKLHKELEQRIDESARKDLLTFYRKDTATNVSVPILANIKNIDFATQIYNDLHFENEESIIKTITLLDATFTQELLPEKEVITRTKKIIQELKFSFIAKGSTERLDLIFDTATANIEKSENIAHLMRQLYGLCSELHTYIQTTGTSTNVVINKIKLNIRKHYAEDITLASISEYLFMSPKYVSDLFKKETGITYSKYLTAVRMEHAKQLLRDIHYKVYEISQLVGYQSPNHFNKVFKHYAGITPSEYRKKETGI